MDKDRFKIVIINHSFQINYYSRRWQLFARKFSNVDVTLLAPAKHEWYKSKGYSFGSSKVMEGHEADAGNYHVRVFRVRTIPFFGWYSPDYKRLLMKIKPDVVYHIGGFRELSLVHLIRVVRKRIGGTKVIVFSMRGPHHNLANMPKSGGLLKAIRRKLDYVYEKIKLNYVNDNVDAFFCHYPDALQAFRDEGYSGPVYMQTQVGVNTEWFYPDESKRKEIRSQLGIDDDTFVFGSATRFSWDKGVGDILRALPAEGNWKYLMMGAGSVEETESLKSIIRERKLEDKVIVTGFVDWYEIAKYWNAVDCAIHVPRTTPFWVETFSLAAIQPQVTGKPVIGDDSGSVPYQIGFDEMIVREGDVEALSRKISWVLAHREEAAALGKKMYERALRAFTIRHLNDMFYDTLVEDILPGKYDEDKTDMASYIPHC